MRCGPSHTRHARQYPQHFTARTRRHSANNMSPHILHCDNSTWMSFFIESRIWEFEIVPAFVQGTDIRRCDNEYALQVLHHLAEHNPQVDNISYRIFNTMQGPIRIQQPLHQPAGAASPAYSTTHFTHHALRTCILSLSYCTYTSFADTSTQHFSVSTLGHSVQSHRIAPASAAQQKLPVPRITTT